MVITGLRSGGPQPTEIGGVIQPRWKASNNSASESIEMAEVFHLPDLPPTGFRNRTLGRSPLLLMKSPAPTQVASLLVSGCVLLPHLDQRSCGNTKPLMQSPDHFERQRASLI
jgi:hypothetical protein